MRRRMTIVTLGTVFSSLAAVLAGCTLYGPAGGAGGAGETDAGDSQPGTTTGLTPITFSPGSGFPQGADPAEFAVGSGSITATGGTAGTLGLPGLYADDAFAWDFLSGTDGRITFDDLDVVAVDGYWVHADTQEAVATMSVRFSGGGFVAIASAAIAASGAFGQPAGFFDTVTAPQGETITELTFEFAEGSATGNVAALDVLELTVR